MVSLSPELSRSDAGQLATALALVLNVVERREPPQWRPAFDAIAQREVDATSIELRADGRPWGPDPSEAARIAAMMLFNRIVENVAAAMALLLDRPFLTAALEGQARLAAEAAAQASWLLELPLSGRARVARSYALRRASARNLESTMQKLGLPLSSDYGSTVQDVDSYYDGQLGLKADFGPKGGFRGCEGQVLGNYSERVFKLMSECGHRQAHGPYARLSGAAHSEFWHIQHDYDEKLNENGDIIFIRLSPRHAAQFATLVCADSVIRPFALALSFLGRRASYRDLISVIEPVNQALRLQ